VNLARYGAAVLAFAVLPITLLGAAPAVPSPSIDTVAGTTVLQQLDSAASLAGVTLVVRAGLDRQTMKQNGVAALVAETIMKTPVGVPAMPLEDAVAARGGSVRFRWTRETFVSTPRRCPTTHRPYSSSCVQQSPRRISLPRPFGRHEPH